MEKFKNFAQKNTGKVGVVLFALIFIYALCMGTPSACLQYYSEYDDFYEVINPINNAILFIGIFGMVFSLLYSLLRCDTRKYYYASNYAWLFIYICFSIFAIIFLIKNISFYQTKYMALPFDQINDYFTAHNIQDKEWLNESTSIFALGYICALLIAVDLILPICTGVMKIKNISKRKNLKPTNSNKQEEM